MRTIGEIIDKCNLIRRVDYNDWEETVVEYYKCKHRTDVIDLIHHYSRQNNIGHIDLGYGGEFILVFVHSYVVNDLNVYTVR